MSDPYRNQAQNYALRHLTGTDYLAFRTVAEERFLRGPHILDLGCGAGRSTRFLKDLGFTVTGADISPEMICEAERQDPEGVYRSLNHSGPLPFSDTSFDGFFSSWMLLEEDSPERLGFLMKELHRVLKPGGRGVVVTNTPEFYQGSWISCEVDFPENTPPLRSGQSVRVRLTPERVELADYFWSDADYKEAFSTGGLRLAGETRPLGRAGDMLPWKDERRQAPYVIYQLERP